MNPKGQVLLEQLLVLFLIIIPVLIGVGAWGTLEYQRVRCAYRCFTEARQQLIRLNAPVQWTIQCGPRISETISLKPLSALERKTNADFSF